MTQSRDERSAEAVERRRKLRDENHRKLNACTADMYEFRAPPPVPGVPNFATCRCCGGLGAARRGPRLMGYRIISITADGPVVVLCVAVAGVTHDVRVSPAGHVLMPADLAGHACRDDIEAACREMVQDAARLGWVA